MMRTTVLHRAFLIAMATAACGTISETANAQHRHRTSHHHHDAMGHRVDDAGHHIDLYGRHTGSVGVYDNGAYSLPTNYAGNRGYWSNGTYYSAAPVGTLVPNTVNSNAVISNAIPGSVQNVIPSQAGVVGRPPQNVVPGMTIPGNGPVGKIYLTNPTGSGGEIRYRLNSTDYVTKEGQSQSLDNDRVWVISFGSGGTRGDVRYTLGNGTFKFKVTEGGWDLVKAADQTVVDQPDVAAEVPAPVPQPDGPSASSVARP